MRRVLILLLCLSTLATCRKDLSYKYAFNVNGVSCRGDNYSAIYHKDTVAGLQEFVADFYIGNVSDTTYVQISFSGNNYIAPGTYYSGITNQGNTMCSFAYNKNHVYYNTLTGILAVSQIDSMAHSLRGSFQFKAVSNISAADSVLVSNGAFSGINYVIE